VSDHASIHHALAAAQAEFPVVPKDRKAKVPTKAGGSYEYRYADFGSILAAIEPVLRRHGIMQYQRLDVREGKQLLCTELWHSSGTSVCAAMLVPLDGRAPQEVGSAITYFRRYSMVALLGLVTEEDNDAQHTRARPKPAAAPQPVARAAPAPVETRPHPVMPPEDDRGQPTFLLDGVRLTGEDWIDAAVLTAKRLQPSALLIWWEKAKDERAKLHRRRPDLNETLDKLKAKVLAKAATFNGGPGHVSPDDALRAG
jgi:hypothetical protein